ncbi:kinase-like domain-containing protein [Xylaria castorea]|nr:kinase-like domain-containing protein [Xylaria castorea]
MDENNNIYLDVGHTLSESGNSSTLATIGRDGDIVIEGAGISKTQCSFELNFETGYVLFYDRSHGQTSQVYGKNRTPFEYGRPRKVVVHPNLNTEIGFGGVNRNLFQFRLIWHDKSTAETVNTVKTRVILTLQGNPRLAETIDDADTELPSERQTRIHTTRPKQLPMRWEAIGGLGSGTYADVFKGFNIDDGRLMAVKRMKPPTNEAEREWMKARWMREAHIVEYISSEGWDGDSVDVFMALKEGTLKSLMENGCPVPPTNIGYFVCHHILQAIDFLSVHGIIHRDIKPENILYVTRSDHHYFQLGDFGISSHQFHASSMSGTRLFMAPEAFHGGEQTHKADVWSLFVTMLWTLGGDAIQTFFTTCACEEGIYDSIVETASEDRSVAHLLEMGRINHEERASAAQMLVKYYGGEGLTTPRNKIAPLWHPAPVTRQNPFRSFGTGFNTPLTPQHPLLQFEGEVQAPVTTQDQPPLADDLLQTLVMACEAKLAADDNPAE